MKGSTLKCKYERKMYVIDECLETGFMTLKAIGTVTVFGTTNFQLRKLNDHKRCNT